jgi:uncharacterized protein (TIGR02246 family)
VLSLAALAFAPVAHADPQTQAAIEAQYAKFSAAVAAGKADAVAALYTKDAILMPPAAPPMVGRGAIEKTFEALMGMGIAGVAFDVQEVELLGDTATEVGGYTLTAKGGQIADQGKYVVIWKREGATWYLHRDIFNTNIAPPAAK